MTRRRRTASHRKAICEARKWQCHICGLAIDPTHEKWALDHVIALAAGGKDEDDNLCPVHTRCHLEKTKADVAVIAKGVRIRAKHLGIKRSSRPMPCGRHSPWKKKFDGSVVPRVR
jgi:hypothetical protein